VLTNVVGNAIKFSPPGAVVELTSAEGEGMVQLSVRDHGRGVPADKQSAIFERFEQVDSSDSRERGGSGLGLAISRDIVRLHGGRIWVESEVGDGATFRFTLPSAPDATGVDLGTEQPVTRVAPTSVAVG
jgi:signal transduction histidine kinase